MTPLLTCGTQLVQTECDISSDILQTIINTTLPTSCCPSPASSIPDLLPCSDLDSYSGHKPLFYFDDSYRSSHYILDLIGTYNSMSSESPAMFSQEYKAPPILAPSVLTLALLCAFQIGASQYFVQKKVPNDKCVAQVVWGLCDPHIQIDTLTTRHVSMPWTLVTS
jgi:hypothetical protein